MCVIWDKGAALILLCHFPAKHKWAFYGQTYFVVHTALGFADASHSLSRKSLKCVCVCVDKVSGDSLAWLWAAGAWEKCEFSEQNDGSWEKKKKASWGVFFLIVADSSKAKSPTSRHKMLFTVSGLSGSAVGNTHTQKENSQNRK